MQGLNNLVVSGKVLYLGVSDSPAWCVAKANQYARCMGLATFVYVPHSFPCLSFLFFPFPSLLSSSLSFVFFVVNITIGFIKGSGQLQQEIWSETSSRCARPREWALLLGTLLAEACSKQTKRYKRTSNQVRGERKGDERREINWRIRWGCLSYFFFFLSSSLQGETVRQDVYGNGYEKTRAIVKVLQKLAEAKQSTVTGIALVYVLSKVYRGRE